MSPDSVLHMLQRVLKRAGLPRIRFHDLRHTFATMALQNGVDVKTVSSMLGHYSAGFTLDTYAHVTGQRVAHAPAGAETGGAAPYPVPRSAAHLRNHGAAKRRGRENGQQYARTLLRGLHAGHLRPRDH